MTATAEVVETQVFEHTRGERVALNLRLVGFAAKELLFSLVDLTEPHIVGDQQPLGGRIERNHDYIDGTRHPQFSHPTDVL